MYTKRSMLEFVLLLLFTCGIYGIYWNYMMSEELGRDVASGNNPSIDILLIFITCGLYGLYLQYRHADQCYQAKMKRGMIADNKSVLCLLLAIFGVGIVGHILLQQEINDLVDYDNGMMSNQFNQMNQSQPF